MPCSDVAAFRCSNAAVAVLVGLSDKMQQPDSLLTHQCSFAREQVTYFAKSYPPHLHARAAVKATELKSASSMSGARITYRRFRRPLHRHWQCRVRSAATRWALCPPQVTLACPSTAYAALELGVGALYFPCRGVHNLGALYFRCRRVLSKAQLDGVQNPDHDPLVQTGLRIISLSPILSLTLIVPPPP